MENWKPRTELGRRVKNREITDINEILDNGWTILEPEITDALLPDIDYDLLLIGQSKGKYGGGRRRVFRQTQKKTREGNKPQFGAYAVIGNEDGIVGLGYGKARETVPARNKAVAQAKKNVFKIARGSGSWESAVKEPHTVPFEVEGKCGSVVVRLKPAPKGKGLVAEKEMQKILKAAGIEDVWSETFGQTKNKVNLVKAVEEALRKLTTTKLRDKDESNLAVTYGNAEPMKVAQQFEAAKQARPAKKAPAEQPAPQPAAQPVDEEETSAPAEQAPSGSTPLSEIKGVGAKTAESLKAAGFTSAEDVAEASIDALTAVDGVGKATAEKFVSAAKEAVQ